MWNEHCSYKSSRLHLRGLPTIGAAGDPGPGRECRRDRHRRRARLRVQDGEPQPPLASSSPTRARRPGVGGILRDVFTMGARPIACLNALRFGAPDHPQDARTSSPASWRASAATAIPSACRRSAARIGFDPRYDGNILVNAMAVGLARTDGIFYAKADRRREPDRLSRLQDRPRRHRRRHHGVGRVRRGRRGEAPDRAGRRPLRRKAAARSLPRADGAPAPSSPSRTWARPASPPRRSRWAPRATSASSSTSTRCPCRETGMTAYEMMLSESQERMLMVLKPGKRGRGRGDLPQVGPRLRGHRQDHRHAALRRSSTAGRSKADLPIKELGDEAPLYDRPHVADTAPAGDRGRRRPAPPMRTRDALLAPRRLARPRLEALGLGAVRPPDPAATPSQKPGRRRRRRAGRGRAEGPGADLPT